MSASGSIASLWPWAEDFRSNPINRHSQCPSACLKRAKNGSRSYSITVSARRRLANGAGCLNVNNDAELHVDEVVVGVSKKCRSLVSSGPLRRGIGQRDELRDNVAGRPPSLVVEGCQILLHGAAGSSRIAIPMPILTCDRALLVGIGKARSLVSMQISSMDSLRHVLAFVGL